MICDLSSAEVRFLTTICEAQQPVIAGRGTGHAAMRLCAHGLAQAVQGPPHPRSYLPRVAYVPTDDGRWHVEHLDEATSKRGLWRR